MNEEMKMQTSLESFRDRWVRMLIVWTVLYGAFALWGLGQMQFWNDEGIMALGGKRVLQFGYPKAWDGQNLFSFEAGYDLNQNLTQIRVPWLGFYIAAFGMKLFGASAFGARFGFTLLGILNLPIAFLVSRQLGLSRATSFLTVAILSSLAGYWLYIRQCYHYPADISFSLLAIICFLKIQNKWSPLGLATCLIALFHLNYMTPVWLTLSFFIWTLWERKFISLLTRPMIWMAIVVTFLGTYSWIQWARVLEFNETLGGWSTFFLHPRLDFVLSELDMSFPILTALPVIVWCGFQSRKDKSVGPIFRGTVSALIAFLICGLHQYAWLRYYLTIFVFLSAVWAVFLSYLWSRTELGAVLFGIVIFCTTFPYWLSHGALAKFLPAFQKYKLQRVSIELATFESPAAFLSPLFFDVRIELEAPARTPLDEVVHYLKEHSKPGEKIVTLYEAEIIQFHTNLLSAYLIDPRQKTYSLVSNLPTYVSSYQDADWLLLRDSWRRNFGMKEFDYDQNQQILEDLHRSGAVLERIPLKIRERFPNQLPNLFGHTWQSDIGSNTMQLYRVHRLGADTLR
jgi:hypothetical protein